MIELKQVSKVYQTGKVELRALHAINFKVSAGDFAVIRGPSGSGKSTLLNILGLLDEPTEGEVDLFEKKISFVDFDALAVLRSRAISFVFQSFNLNPVLTLEENVMVPLMIRKDIAKEEKEARITEWIEKVGLSKHRKHLPDELSGGQRQRVAIARAMVTNPQLVIADEPTANLDSVTTKSILETMRELNQEKGTAFVFATHDPVLESFANRTVHLHDGRIE
ncbi:MAG: ABC transporter ATP-binding protein [Bdellovibrionales bacterium]|nr:ABC transporter ATP-binding protein [Bdellovibrionales bacterium]